MPYVVHTHPGRAALVGGLVVGLTLFSLWFTATGPFSRAPGATKRGSQRIADPRAEPAGGATDPRLRYPPLHRATGGSQRGGAAPDYDPMARPSNAPTHERPLPALLRLLPRGYSVLGMVRVTALRRQGWAEAILTGRRVPRLRATLTPLGFDPTWASRVVFGVDLEARAAARPGKHDHRFLGRYDRPFCLVAEGRLDRKRILQRFRREGPLAAAVVMGRRVYRRQGDYALVFPVRGLVAWSYRRPMAPVLQTMLEDASRSTLTDRVRENLRAGGLGASLPRGAAGAGLRHAAPPSRRPSPAARRPPDSPPSPTRAARRPAGRAPADPPNARTPNARTPNARTPNARTPNARTPGRGTARRRAAPARRPTEPRPRRRTEPRPPRPEPRAVDGGLPWITLTWTPQKNRRVPYPFNRVRGYGLKSALRGAVLTVGPSGPRHRRVRVHLRLLYEDAVTPAAVANTLRFVRRYTARLPRVKRARLSSLLNAVPIEAHGKQIRVTLELRPWHLRALTLLFHKLLEAR